jgi:Trypsin
LPQPSYDEVVGIGSVVGWGQSEQSEVAGEHHDSTPSELEFPAVNNSHYFLIVNSLVTVSSDRTFCAGFNNRSKAPCSGDSGGGIYLLDLSTKLFSLQGIVSASRNDRDQPYRGCDISVFNLNKCREVCRLDQK